MTPAPSPASLPSLALSALRVGCLAFGGGLASYPVFRAEFCDRRGWLSEDDLSAWFATAQAVPGVILVNVAATLGLRLSGRPGAVLAAVCAALPAFCCMLLLSVLWTSSAGNPWVSAALAGLRPAVVALLAAAAVRLARRGVRTLPRAAVALLAAAWLFLGGSPVPVLLAALLLPPLFWRLRRPAP